MRVLAICIVLLTQFCLAQNKSNSEDNRATAFCDFDDGQEVSMRYSHAPLTSKDEPRNGRVWTPGGSPMMLFTGTALTVNNIEIAAGAYSVYVIPNKKQWTLIVNKNVNATPSYDEKEDVLRAPMELGEVQSPPKQLQVSFAHSSAKVCSLRLYYEKTGAFADLTEK